MKLKLTYIRIPEGTPGCIPRSHYDLHTDEKQPSNIACILTDKDGAKLLRKWIKIHNQEDK
jgi:hypothetical protein